MTTNTRFAVYLGTDNNMTDNTTTRRWSSRTYADMYAGRLAEEGFTVDAPYKAWRDGFVAWLVTSNAPASAADRISRLVMDDIEACDQHRPS